MCLPIFLVGLPYCILNLLFPWIFLSKFEWLTFVYFISVHPVLWQHSKTTASLDDQNARYLWLNLFAMWVTISTDRENTDKKGVTCQSGCGALKYHHSLTDERCSVHYPHHSGSYERCCPYYSVSECSVHITAWLISNYSLRLRLGKHGASCEMCPVLVDAGSFVACHFGCVDATEHHSLNDERWDWPDQSSLLQLLPLVWSIPWFVTFFTNLYTLIYYSDSWNLN